MAKWPALALLSRSSVAAFAAVSAFAAVACGGARSESSAFGGAQNGEDAGLAFGEDGGSLGLSTPSGAAGVPDPTTCAQAVSSFSYVGCDYWPTSVANDVWSTFDFAVVVSNGQSVAASVTVSGPNGFSQEAMVAPGDLTKIYLPWNAALKGPDFDLCSNAPGWGQSVTSPGGAYHLVSSVPVTVYQFNALEYQPQGGPPGKDWSSCPGLGTCEEQGDPDYGTSIGCYSYSNDASLLLPSTAMTGNYRLMGIGSLVGQGSYFAVTATQDNTNVTITLSQNATVAAGGNFQAAGPGGIVTFTLNAGDVAEVSGPGASTTEDLSGSLLKANLPVQVIAGHPCYPIPNDDPNATCDHLESSVFPAETLGRDYVVNPPTGPLGAPVGQLLRIYGNVDGTTLSYDPAPPSGCPTTIDAGEVADCGIVGDAFEVTGDHEFGVGLFMQSADVVDPGDQPPYQLGDPSMSFAVAVEQYRSSYIFLAPSDYETSFADVIVTSGTTLMLDGAPVSVAPTTINETYSVVRIPLQVGSTNGAHTLTGNSPFGIQVLGYAPYTSYQYPGGLDLQLIAPPPSQ
jgi:hypothetical protein